MDDRKLGKSLPETGYQYSKVKIYRASPDRRFRQNDYVTLSLKFAIGHAEHQAAVEEEPYLVIEATVQAKDVYEAYNPGEYFYGGPAIDNAKVTKKVEARLLSKRRLRFSQ